MSAVTGAPASSVAEPPPAGAPRSVPARGSGGLRDALPAAALGAGLAAVAFGAQGGSELSRTTTVELGLLLAGGLFAAAAVAYAPAGRAHGALTLLLFALLAAVTALSVAWSVAPGLSWIEANRTLVYLVVFAGAAGAARLAPDGWIVVLKGILIAAALVVGYALLSRVWPATLAPNEIYARIGKPYNYWNAVGVTAALAVPPALWLGSRRSGHPLASALAYPLLGVLIVALFLTYSRGSLAAAVVGAALWLVFVPLRLRSALVLAVSAAGALPLVLWTLSKDAFTQDAVPLAVKEAVAPEFGLLLLVTVAGLLLAGLVAGFQAARSSPSPRARRRLGTVLAVVALGLPLLAFGSVAASDKGLDGAISELTSESATTSGGPERLSEASSARGRYWREAGRAFKDRPVTGTGAGTFAVARLPHRKSILVARHAHGYLPQTASDLGLLGLFATLALALAWLLAAGRTVAGRRLRGGSSWDAERLGVSALVLAAVVFGLQSSIDWTWFVPGPTVMALVAAGFVAARGPLASVGGPPRDPSRSVRLGRLPSRERLLGAVLVLATVAVCAWSTWQPERADDASNRALALLEAGDERGAAREAARAREIDPLSLKPLFVRASIEESAGRTREAAATLEQAVVEHPSDPEAWLRLADFQLESLDRPRAAIRTLQGAIFLDPLSPAAQTALLEALERLRAQRAAANS